MAEQMTFLEFKMKVASTERRDGLRLGQHAFNMLYYANPKIADRIRGNYAIDPFYRDEYLPAFWRAVEGMWRDK